MPSRWPDLRRTSLSWCAAHAVLAEPEGHAPFLACPEALSRSRGLCLAVMEGRCSCTLVPGAFGPLHARAAFPCSCRVFFFDLFPLSPSLVPPPHRGQGRPRLLPCRVAGRSPCPLRLPWLSCAVLVVVVGFGVFGVPCLSCVCLSGVVCVRCGGGASRYACRGFGMAGRQLVFLLLPWLCPQER